MKEIDYISYYAKKMKEDNAYFKDQKMLIESQLKSSREIFKNKFGKDFKKNARLYLKEVGIL
jgi:hypothetical protein